MNISEVNSHPSFRKEIIHGMCAISFNLINQQIYWLVFALYMALTVWTALSLVGHILLKFVPELRSAVIWTQMPRVSDPPRCL